MADLEISNQSLLKINQMLETTVRQQAKQVASFKQKMMTVPKSVFSFFFLFFLTLPIDALVYY